MSNQITLGYNTVSVLTVFNGIDKLIKHRSTHQVVVMDSVVVGYLLALANHFLGNDNHFTRLVESDWKQKC
jgi:hypothetical protein